MWNQSFLALMALFVVAACAPAPESIQPSFVNDNHYQSWTCRQLHEEVLRLDATLAAASFKQHSARSSDKIGVLFTGLPLASISGQNIAPEIARYKGEKEAARRVLVLKQCAESASKRDGAL